MVIAGGNVHNARFFDFLGYLININCLCNLGIAPCIHLALLIKADTEGGPGNDLLDAVLLHGVRYSHHIQAGRYIHLRVILLRQIDRQKYRTNQNEEQDG